ncbi:cytochrome P450 89A2-like [Neltuma alba]|uniref:cytochrome P450 89A2-like n=1 Tax=Neltuma alba TaxID=207710 RepID=UPI0010A47618|nr:cytochrome P450 89A2-like [Prosopis alba]
MELKPERFLSSERNGGEAFDITGRKEIKMMPFGVGRKMCPGYVLAMLHVEYFVANLVWSFEWKVSNSEVDLSEKQELSVVMKNPLQAYLSPRITRILFRERWQELFQTRKEQESVLIPLIRARKKAKEERLTRAEEDSDNSDRVIVPYVDTLLDLEWPEEKRSLEESEIVSVSSEFINAGTDTTATALQWIMANLVKYPHIQERLVEEIRGVMGDRKEKEVKEEDLNKLPYLKAVILEGLRRHPPAHFVLPHAVKEDVVLNGFLIPKNGTINFLVAEMGWDPKVWENPMEFKPERFLSMEKDGDEVFDITGSKEIKMIPFGAGRRICPGYNLAMFHLEYFVANLFWNFEWKVSNGDVDLSENQVFTVMMKNPLQVHISPRV